MTDTADVATISACYEIQLARPFNETSMVIVVYRKASVVDRSKHTNRTLKAHQCMLGTVIVLWCCG